jgi:hypothetical protein
MSEDLFSFSFHFVLFGVTAVLTRLIVHFPDVLETPLINFVEAVV